MLCVCVCVRAERTAPDCPRRSLGGIFWVRRALDKERYRPIYFFTTDPLVLPNVHETSYSYTYYICSRLSLRQERAEEVAVRNNLVEVRLLQLIEAGEHLLHLSQVSEW